MSIKDTIQGLIAVGVLTWMIFGGITYFAKAGDLKLVEMRLEQKIVNDQIIQIKQKMWQLEDRNKGTDCTKWKDEKDRKEYRELNQTLDELKKQQEKK